MIMAPNFVAGAMFEGAVAKALDKRNDCPASPHSGREAIG